MSCELPREYMMKYLDKNINDIENAQLKHHLKECESCSEVFKSFNEVFCLLENDIIEPPQDLEVQIMGKINELELIRRKRNNRFLAGIYGFTTAVFIALSIMIGAYLNQMTFIEVLNEIGNAFGSSSMSILGLYSHIMNAYEVFTGIIGILFQVSILLIKSYYYIFIALFIMFLVIQKMFFNLVKEGGGHLR